MSGISIKDYKIHNLQKEYVTFSSYLHDVQFHINKLYYEGIITSNEKNIHLKTINEFIRKVNSKYNKPIHNPNVYRCINFSG